jgi:murein DD-endopeptidase MepM/ murein hydrolase activator NlpD
MANFRSTMMAGVGLLILAGCEAGPVDFDLRGNGAGTREAALAASAARPAADNRGVISYPGYQVAVARRGDTVSALAARVGVPAEELARYNGLASGDSLRDGEVLSLPRRVSEPVTTATAAVPSAAGIDVTTLAGAAIDRSAGSGAPVPAAAPARDEPVRHKVVRGETAYSVARLYGVSVRALAEWNGLGPDFAIREGQLLMIPVAAEAPPPAVVEAPGIGSVTPVPPSGAAPLPPDTEAAAVRPPGPEAPALETTRSSRLAMPVAGKVIRPYVKSKNEGIDIAAAAGTPVVAAADGTVAAITRDTDQVPILVIRHADNLLTVYAGLDAISVQKGDRVSRSQPIGKVRAGNPSFVHFEVREGFESTDPVPFLN